jgi:chromosome segregation ATPase
MTEEIKQWIELEATRTAHNLYSNWDKPEEYNASVNGGIATATALYNLLKKEKTELIAYQAQVAIDAQADAVELRKEIEKIREQLREKDLEIERSKTTVKILGDSLRRTDQWLKEAKQEIERLNAEIESWKQRLSDSEDMNNKSGREGEIKL